MGKDLKGKELGCGISQRKDGRYQARFTKKDGKRVEKNFPKVTEAREWLAKQRYMDDVADSGDMLVDDWYEQWISLYKEDVVADKTLKGYKNRYKVNIKGAIGNMKLCDVRQVHCQQILNNMRSLGKYSVGTIELTKITLHALFKDAVENDYIVKNPADGLRIKRNRSEDTENKERRVLSREEQRIFKEYASNTYYNNAYCLVLETGLRVGELGALKWDCIDFDNKYLYVNHTLLQEKEKGGFYFGDPKSMQSKRKIPLTNEAISILKNQKILQSKVKIKSKKWECKWNGLVFTTQNGNPVGASTFREMILRIVANINFDRKLASEEAKVPYVEFKHMGMHSLRHTFATRCIENDMNPKSLQKILGHSSIGITMDLYVHALDEQVALEMEKMNTAV